MLLGARGEAARRREKRGNGDKRRAGRGSPRGPRSPRDSAPAPPPTASGCLDGPESGQTNGKGKANGVRLADERNGTASERGWKDEAHRGLKVAEFSRLWDRARDETEAYDRRILMRYAPNSKEVYGEVNPKLVDDMLREAEVGRDDVFYDLGSGVGNVVLQASAQTGCSAIGVEVREELHAIAVLLKQSCVAIAGDTNMFARTNFVRGDVSHDDVEFGDATVIFVNNFCYPEALEQKVLHKIGRTVRDGVRVISLKSFGPRFRPTRLVQRR
jgi:hypothetical protein